MIIPEQIAYRPYFPGDESVILDLFQSSFGKEMTKDFWKWRFLDNPVGQLMIELAWDDRTLASHYAVSPVMLTVKEQDYITALSMTTMTQPRYRGHGLFPVLAKSLYDRLKQHDYLMVWGFPNNQSHRTFRNHLAWRDIYEIPTFYLNLDDLFVTPKVSKYISELAGFDKRFDSLWEQVKSSNDILIKRDQKYLNWRYTLNPQHEYRIFAYIDNNELLGYAVFKEFNSDIDIVDILTVQDDHIGEELIFAVLDIARQHGNIKGINIWLSVHYPLHYRLEKIGFTNDAPVTYFGVRRLSSHNPQGVILEKFSCWYIQMGDSDVY